MSEESLVKALRTLRGASSYEVDRRVWAMDVETVTELMNGGYLIYRDSYYSLSRQGQEVSGAS